MAKRKAEAEEEEVDRNAFESEEDSVGSGDDEEEEEEVDLWTEYLFQPLGQAEDEEKSSDFEPDEHFEYLFQPLGRAEDEEKASDFEPDEHFEDGKDIEDSDEGEHDPKAQSSSKRKRSGFDQRATERVRKAGTREEDDVKEEEELVDNEHANFHPETPSERPGAASASARVTTEVGGSASINLEVSMPASGGRSKVSVTVKSGSASAQVEAQEPAKTVRKRAAR